LRFLLEVAALVGVGVAAWTELDGAARWIGVIGGPVALMVMWGTFNVPGDPSRGGGAPVPVSGRTRLIIEFAFFAVASAAFAVATGMWWPAAVFAVTVIVHYILSLDRVGWLLTR
jgi:hypothetical protein